MARSKKEKSSRVDCDCKKASKVNAPIILEDLIVKELTLSLEDGDMRKLSVRTDPTNEDSTCVKQKIRILDHPKKPYRGSTRKASNCIGFNWEQHYNKTKPVPFYLNLPR